VRASFPCVRVTMDLKIQSCSNRERKSSGILINDKDLEGLLLMQKNFIVLIRINNNTTL